MKSLRNYQRAAGGAAMKVFKIVNWPQGDWPAVAVIAFKLWGLVS